MIFLSHSSKDKHIIEPIAKKLIENFGEKRVFYDSDSMAYGDGTIDKMNEGLESFEDFFFFLSENSLVSNQVKIEWQNALNITLRSNSRRFFVVKLDDSKSPAIIGQSKYIDIRSCTEKESFEKIMYAIEGKTGNVRNDFPHDTDFDENWAIETAKEALDNFYNSGKNGFMETWIIVNELTLKVKEIKELLEEIKPPVNNVFSYDVFSARDFKKELYSKKLNWSVNRKDRFGFWSINNNGAFYSLTSLAEDIIFSEHIPGQHIFYDYRIKSIVELLIFVEQFYNKVGLEPTSQVTLKVRINDLQKRKLIGWRRIHLTPREITYRDKNETITEITTSLKSIKKNKVQAVKQLTEDLFEAYDFEHTDRAYEVMINEYEKTLKQELGIFV